ncbi:MAG: hypothetical protein J3K34DRAFT_295115 [Monoraphidium minutum]|nr:MAG: hypothetical protein J3K34DRAFT_295115 [Monoraphidium minutum]
MRQGRLALALLALAFAAAPAAGAKDKGYRGRIAFEGSALLVTYYSGVHQALLERGALVPGETQLAGLSGGGYSSVGATLGKTGLEMRDVWKGIVAGCAAQFAGGCVGHLNAYIVAHLLDALPEDAHKTASKTVNILVSQLDGNNNDSLANSASWTLDKFKNKADLISALTSTNYIPCYSGMTLFNFHRNEPVIDGGYSSGFKELCLKAKGGDCLKVASYHVGPLGDATCDPALCPVLAQSNCIEAARLETTTKLYKARLNAFD